jgi:hypothetical protein
MHRISVGVDLGDGNLTFTGDLLEHRTKGLARATPGSPEIHEDPPFADGLFVLAV